MMTTESQRLAGDLTLPELRDFIRQVLREEGFTRWRTDKTGNLIFLAEDDYALFLSTQKGKLPGQVKAYFIDEQGFTARYADETPTAQTRRRIGQAKRDIAANKGLSLETVRQRLGLR